MNVPPELSAILGALGGAAIVLVRSGAKYLRYRMLRARVQGEEKSIRGPLYGSAAWVHQELSADQRRERGARHVLARDLWALAQRVARLEGRNDSGEQERVSFTNENDTEPAPPLFADDPRDDPRTPVDPAVARARARRSRP